MNTENINALPHNLRRGAEQEQHNAAKNYCISLAKTVGSSLIIPEDHYGDVVYWLDGKRVFEPESSSKHCIENILRDDRNGASSIITVALDFATLAAIARRFSRELPPHLIGRVGLMSIEAVRALTPK